MTDHRAEAIEALAEIEDPGTAAITHALLWLGEILASQTQLDTAAVARIIRERLA